MRPRRGIALGLAEACWNYRLRSDARSTNVVVIHLLSRSVIVSFCMLLYVCVRAYVRACVLMFVTYSCCYRNVGPPRAVSPFCGFSSYYEYDGKKPLLSVDNPTDDIATHFRIKFRHSHSNVYNRSSGMATAHAHGSHICRVVTILTIIYFKTT